MLVTAEGQITHLFSGIMTCSQSKLYPTSGGADGHCIPQQVPPGGVGINAPENEDYSWTIVVPLGA